MTHYLTALWRHFRNLDRLEATEAQLTICRAMLATTMRERNELAMATEMAQLALWRHLRRRQEERLATRAWITRCTTGTPVNWN